MYEDVIFICIFKLTFAKFLAGGATFGAAPSFGSKPSFGSPSPLVSAFGQRSQNTASTTTGFSRF